jgi:transposase InsO family protein
MLKRIRKMANENSLWAAERIRGELLNLGIRVYKRTIQKYLPKGTESISLSRTWTTFAKNYARDIWACDLTVAYDWLFRPWIIFVVLELKTGRIAHFSVTRFPTDQWIVQQLRKSTSAGEGPKYILHDWDIKYGSHFSPMAAGICIKEPNTPYRAPRGNANCKRFMGILRRECLDHILILHGGHLTRAVKEYSAYFNQEQSDQGIDYPIPYYFDLSEINPAGNISSRAILGGLHQSYSR